MIFHSVVSPLEKICEQKRATNGVIAPFDIVNHDCACKIVERDDQYPKSLKCMHEKII